MGTNKIYEPANRIWDRHIGKLYNRIQKRGYTPEYNALFCELKVEMIRLRVGWKN